MIKKSGFTLVELLIVISMLGILAALVVPMFSDAGQKARDSALKTDLQKVRTQVEVYRSQHDDQLPAFSSEASADFERRMTTQTDRNGSAGSDYGPYLNKIPKNPYNDKNTVRIDGAAAGANTDGWRLDSYSGIFQADDSTENASF
ncbi:MAG: type II secretion system protein [Sedimentisphaerales bacterium]|nr:type II secretion system protein [Sedimentisphaerales bacterium]